MKPDKDVARRGDYVFGQIPHAEGAEFIKANHYARGCSKTGVMFGMYRTGGVLVGVAQWLPPTKVCAQSVLPEYWTKVISLTRLAVAPGEPQNAATMLIGASIKWLRTLRTPEGAVKWRALVTFADESQGHTGAIYKATNWLYKGTTGAYPRWLKPDGTQVATQSGPKTRTAQEMRDLGYEMVGKFRKHKFVMFLT